MLVPLVLEEDTQAMVLPTITINAALAAEEDTLIILGLKPHEADTPVRVEQFTTSVSRVRQPRQVHIQRPRLTTKAHVVRQSIRQRGALIVVQVEHMPGMAIITFFVLFAEI